MNKTEEVLNRLDKYLSLVRYQYTTQEKLSRLNILTDYYKTKSNESSIEKLSTKFEISEQLGKDLKLPLKVRGVFLTEGRPQRKYYPAEELMKATENSLNANFPLMLDHKDKEAGKVIGMVDKIRYDEQLRGIRWWGHINDETFARNVMDKAIKEVSATIYSVEEYDENLGIVGRDLTFKELSLVLSGAEPNNYVEVDE
jgi:hypothetical protein